MWPSPRLLLATRKPAQSHCLAKSALEIVGVPKVHASEAARTIWKLRFHQRRIKWGEISN